MLHGRLGLETARVPNVDRHGLLWVDRGELHVENGTLRLTTAGGILPSGDYAIPFQMVSCILAGPGTSVTHDALRLLARHGTGIVFTGDGGVRMYASMPFGPDNSAVARRQAASWAVPARRLAAARRMYEWRFGEAVPASDIAVLRGIEGTRMKEVYRLAAERFGVRWSGRRYDRTNPGQADVPNQALNHAATAAEAVASVAVAVGGALPQLGFIHEDSGLAFVLDIADLVRHSFTVPVAFEAARAVGPGGTDVERITR